MPLLLLTLVFRMLESLLVAGFDLFADVWRVRASAPIRLTFYIYTQGLRNFNFGAAAASSWIFMAFASFAIALVFWFQRRDW